MNARLFTLLSLMFAATALAQTYTNHIFQIQTSGTMRELNDLPQNSTEPVESPLAIEPGGARFELWTIKSGTPPKSTLLDTRYVSTYTPVGNIAITSTDPYHLIPRTRADQPFFVKVVVEGLSSDPSAQEPAKSVKFLRHTQSYGSGGTGVNIDRSQATLLSQSTISGNGETNLTFGLTAIPGADRSKIRGEERFSLYTLEDYQAPESQLASMFVQVWPVADGTISGIENGDSFRFKLPELTVTLNDLYPESSTYAQVYTGSPRLGETGKVIPGSALVVNESIPVNRVLQLKNYESLFDSDGTWTMELLTTTPFGTDRLFYVTFTVDRAIKVNGTFTTIE
ncbi:MAG: hypothetical protein V4733_04935 [Verrucomicrobiota bacterium]